MRALFEATLDRAPEERASYLDEACEGDADLRREVVGLLTASEDADAWFGGLASRAGALFLDSFPPDDALPAETAIGAYRLLRQVGRGGMGAVFLAERADGEFEMRVAIKLVPTDGHSPGMERRFRAERQILASLNHPGIARLLDGGITSDGTPYFVMEYVEGEPIDRYCATRRLDIPARLDLFLQVADAVDFAHRAGVVHRDLKPKNILVAEDGRVKLLDFGIAKVMEGEYAVEVTRDDGGISPLTLAYASPEQVEGRTAGYTSDIYQLGLLLYHLLVGRGPIRASGSTLIDVVRRILEGNFQPPSEAMRGEREERVDEWSETTVPPAALPEAVEGTLDGIVMHALERDSEARYPTVELLADDVRKYLKGRTVRVPGTSRLARARHGLRRHRRSLTVAALAAAATAALFLARPWSAPADLHTLPEHRIAVMPFIVTGGDEHRPLENMLATVLDMNLDGIGGVETLGPDQISPLMLGEAGALNPRRAADVAASLGAGRFIASEAFVDGGRLRLTARLHATGERGRTIHGVAAEGSPDSALVVADQLSARLMEAMLPPNALRHALSTTQSMAAVREFVDGEHHYRAGRYERARDAYTRAIAHDSTFALAYYRLSLTREWGGFGGSGEPAREAVRWTADLPDLERRLVSALDDYLRGDDDLAESRLRFVVSNFPGSIEGRYLLGEVQYHRWPKRGVGARASAEQYRQVLRWDPDNLQAMIHLARLVALERDAETLADLVARYRAHSEADEVRTLEMRALLAGLRDDDIEVGAVSDLRFPGAGNRPWLTAFRVAIYTGNIVAARRMLEPLYHEGRPRLDSALGHAIDMLFQLARGRPGEAAAQLSTVRRHNPDNGVVMQVLHLLGPERAPTSSDLSSGRVTLHAWSPSPHSRGDPARLGSLSERLAGFEEREANAYYRARIAIELEYLDEAEGHLSVLEAVGSDLARFLAIEIRARLAWARGDAAQALRILEAPQTAEAHPHYNSGSTILVTGLHMRWLRAELLREEGRLEEARSWYGAFEDDHPFALLYLPIAYLRIAELSEALGEPDQARFHYGLFIGMWRDAEPEMRHLLKRAEERMRALG